MLTSIFFLLLILVIAALGLIAQRGHTAAKIAESDLAGVRAQLWHARRGEQAAIERLHAVSDSALRGHPMVQWRHPAPQPASDLWYWRARFDGTEYLFTEEAVRTARQRASLLLPAGREVTCTSRAKSEAPAGGAALQPTA